MALSRIRKDDPKQEAYPPAVEKGAICRASIDLIKEAFIDEYQASDTDMEAWSEDIEAEYNDHIVAYKAKAKALLDALEKAAIDKPQQINAYDKYKALTLAMYLHATNELKVQVKRGQELVEEILPSDQAITGPQLKKAVEGILKDVKYFADEYGNALYTNINLKSAWHNDNIKDDRPGKKEGASRSISIVKGGNPVLNAANKATPTKEVDVEGTKENLKAWFLRLKESSADNASKWSKELTKQLKTLGIKL